MHAFVLEVIRVQGANSDLEVECFVYSCLGLQKNLAMALLRSMKSTGLVT